MKPDCKSKLGSSFNLTHILSLHSPQHGLQPYTYTCICLLSLSVLIYGLVPQGQRACLFVHHCIAREQFYAYALAGCQQIFAQ